MQNPYVTPLSTAHSLELAENRLVYIWVWLGFTSIGSFLATPADLFAILTAMIFALPCYLLGVVWGSEIRGSMHWLISIPCALVGSFFAVVTWFPLVPYNVSAAVVFAVGNFILGMKSCRDVIHKQRRIFTVLSLSYLTGLLLGPFGVVILCVPTTLIANRNTREMLE